MTRFGLDLDPAEWARVNELLDLALERPAAERERWIEGLPAGDEPLKPRLRALLSHAPPDGGPQQQLTLPRLARPLSAEPPADDPWLGQCLGPWRLTRLIGRGGMGLVYGAARADGQYQAEVAVKLVRGGPRDRSAGERFRTERQVLAALKHPNIAGLLDGGFAPDGTPYIVMELVDGVTITEWCGRQVLSLEARLGLFRVVCDAVQHAHGALVVHRDLKPANILVSKAGEVKLLDFGIAKLLEPEAWGLEPEQTRAEQRVLTREYAAPEQIEGSAVTTATDVYALGVLLYELIAGVRPLGRHAPAAGQTRGGAPTTATPPSEAIRRGTTAAAGSEPDAAAHETRPIERRRLYRRVRGDLDRIVLRALREEPERRYASAGQLGEEIGRFLEGRAVLAQPDTVAYRLRKFVGRNRLAVSASVLLVAGLAAFGGISARQAAVLAEQRRVAQLERDTSEQVVRVLVELFEASNPSLRPDGERMPLGEFLAGAEARSLDLLRETPAVQAKLQQVFGLIHYTRGQYAPARKALEEALAKQRRLLPPDAAETLETLRALGEACHFGGDDARARALLDEALERHLRAYGERDARTARVLQALAPVVAARDLDQAGDLLRRALWIRRATLPAGHPDVAASLAALGGYHYRRQELGKARDTYREALDELGGPGARRSPLAISILTDLASTLGLLDSGAEAEAMLREAIALAREVLGPGSFTVANLLNNLGTTQVTLGRHAEAERSLTAAFESHVTLLGPAHPRTRNVARNLGRALESRRQYAEALVWMDRAVAAAEGGSAPAAGEWLIRAQRGHLVFRLGRREEGLALVNAAVASLQRLEAPDAAPPLAAVRVLLGRMLVDSGRPREAEPPLEAALAWLQASGSRRQRQAEASCELARARILRGADDEEWRRLERCLPTLRTMGHADPEGVAALERLLASRPRQSERSQQPAPPDPDRVSSPAPPSPRGLSGPRRAGIRAS